MQFLTEKNRVIFLALLYCLSFFYLISSVQRFFLENDPGISLYFQYANQVFSHKIPYHDFMFEYPPFSLLFMLLPRALSSIFSEYSFVFLIMLAIAGLLGLLITRNIAKRRKGGLLAPICYILIFIAIGPLTFFRYDLFPATMTLLSIWLLINGHKKSAWFVIGLAVATKIYPLVIVPFFFIDDFKNVKQKIYDFSFFLLAIVISILPFIAHLNDLKKFIVYHSARGIQIESLWANFLMIKHLIDHSTLRVISEAGTFGVRPFPQIFIPLSLIIFFVGFLLIFLSFLKKKKKIILHSFSAVLLFILANKVFSPQYMIWLVVLFPLAIFEIKSQKHKVSAFLLFFIAAYLTNQIYPDLYGKLLRLESPAVMVLTIRNLSLLFLFILIFFSEIFPDSAIRKSGASLL